jgi:microcystin degradation protein MlrC
MITAAESHNTFTGIPAPLYRRLEELERQPDVLTAGLYMAMPWFDCPGLGWTVTLTVEEAGDEWQSIVDDLAVAAWELRAHMEDVDRLPPEQVVDRALTVVGHPVVIGDGADATNSGAPGDSTVLLAEFLKRSSIPHGALTFLIDADAVHAAQQCGEGGHFEHAIGGRLSEYSEPVPFSGTVEKLVDIKWVLSGHICDNLPINMGAGAIVRSGDVTVLLCERSGPGSSPVLYESVGLDPRDFGIVVAKSPAGFRADYRPFAADMLLVDSPGCAAPRWSQLSFENVNRPLWPLDPIESPEAAEWAC